MQGLGEHAVPHRLHHFDHAGRAGGGLRVGDVRLERSQPQWLVAGPVLAVGGQQRLCLDRVAQPGAGPVRLDRVHLGAGKPGVGQRLADDALLGRAVRRGQPVGRAIGVDRRAPDHRQHPVAEAAGIGEPFQEQQAHPLAPANAVGRGGERLAPAVR